jgi:hypothetical protein
MLDRTPGHWSAVKFPDRSPQEKLMRSIDLTTLETVTGGYTPPEGFFEVPDRTRFGTP